MKKIVLVHPDRETIKSFMFLVENDIIPKRNLEVDVLFLKEVSRNYNTSIKFFKENKPSNFNFISIEGKFNSNDFSKENEFSGLFLDIFNNSSEVYFLGGSDFPSKLYGERQKITSYSKCLQRHLFELSFLYHLLGNENLEPFLEKNPNYSIKGICLGMQTLNIAGGGNLYQDIISEVYNLDYIDEILNLDIHAQHKNYDSCLFSDRSFFTYNIHEVKNVQTKEVVSVLSYHHQAIKRLSNQYEVSFLSMDGKIIEGIQHKKYKNVSGVQFHPENLRIFNKKSLCYDFPKEGIFNNTIFNLLREKKSLKFHLDYFNN